MKNSDILLVALCGMCLCLPLLAAVYSYHIELLLVQQSHSDQLRNIDEVVANHIEMKNAH